MVLADDLELSLEDQRAVYYASLLRSLGCTAHASTFAALFDDDVAVQRELKTLELEDPAERAAQTARFAAWAGEARARELADRLAVDVPAHGSELSRGSCEVSAALGSRLQLPAGAIAALDEVYERYDGRGFPAGLAGDELSMAARVVHVAEQAVMAHYDGGIEGAARVVAKKAEGHLDPSVCAVFAGCLEPVAAALDAPDVLVRAVSVEPPPAVRVPVGELESVCATFGAFADLKGQFLLGHSSHVTDLADRAAALAGLGEDSRMDVRAAGQLLDIGRVGVSSAIWDRPRALGEADWERVRLHSYWTERILRRSPALERLAPLAAAHHERLDGSGYHRGARGSDLSPGARLLAAADVFSALTEDRPHRAAFSRSDAALTLREQVRALRLDADAAEAVVEAAGLPRARTAWPNELTDREVDVLRVLARGLSNQEIADELVLSPRTVQAHLARVYDKIQLRTRSGAAVFAIEHGLVPAAER
jgi:HD-GYP domain-containing protein (c-di-GMP phosphodiesterase class II)